MIEQTYRIALIDDVEVTLRVRNDRFAVSSRCPLLTRKRLDCCIMATDARLRGFALTPPLKNFCNNIVTTLLVIP
jgi:hypothetical protein